MKFLANSNTSTQPYTTPTIENYIYNTKDDLAIQLPDIYKNKQKNITAKENKAIKKLKEQTQITIKPADKNLGMVVLDTSDYLDKCLVHLSSTTYQLVEAFPNSIKRDLENTIIKFKPEIVRYNQRLYKFLMPTEKHRIPRFYGLPKIHKISSPNETPPIRPIVSHTSSLLSCSAKFIDHVLQPIAKCFPDYLHNSSELILKLSTLPVPKDITLVSMDVTSLFPSIPQKECLKIVFEEIQHHLDLLTFDPNLIMQLLNINMHNNYFEFGNFHFHQSTGIAMGAAFSPTIANIFMSALLREFLKTTKEHPILITRYIDDIFLIWPKMYNLNNFISAINRFHPNIKFTTESSDTSINFLDLTIFKGTQFTNHEILDIKTFQKQGNLYQYLHFTSNHPRSTFQSIIIGECIRYARSNTNEHNYHHFVTLLKTRLQKRGYPINFVEKYIKKVNYNNRNTYLQTNLKKLFAPNKPILKCLPPPRFNQLKQIIVQRYKPIRHLVNHPIFVTLRHKTLQDILVKSKFHPTDTDIIDIHFTCSSPQPNNSTKALPQKIKPIPTPQPSICYRPRCATCQHFNNENYFKSTTTRKCYKIRHPFTCSSNNVIYLITCNKCKKQYVGKTNKSLRERINHHRASIRMKQIRYINVHFNFPDHNLSNLTVQAIDTTSADKLAQLEKYWINTLQTQKPKGLNYIN